MWLGQLWGKKRHDLTDPVEAWGYWTGYSGLGYMVINMTKFLYLIKLPEPDGK